jgi:hypothetical protein
MRKSSVISSSHEGKKELVLDVAAAGAVVKDLTSLRVDFAIMQQRMADLIQKNVLDPDLRAWFAPEFSTSTETDRGVGIRSYDGHHEELL